MTDATMLTCASCGNEEPEGAAFCGNCGAPFVHADPQPTDTTPIEASMPTEVIAPATTDLPPEVAPPPAEPQTEPPDPAPLPPDAAASPADSRRRLRPVVLIPALLLLIAGAAAAVLFGTGVIGGNSGTSESALVKQVNEHVLGPLGQADETAAEDADTSDASLVRAEDGDRIVHVADAASVYLGALSGLSGQQKDQVRLLNAVVAENRSYGQAFAAFTATDNQAQLTLDSAATAARNAIAIAESRLDTSLELPAQTVFVSLRSGTQSLPSSTADASPSASDASNVYVRQVDDLLTGSHTVVLALNAFVTRAASGAISRSTAVSLARSFADQRRLALAQAQGLTVPPVFAQSQQLLISALQASLANDEALVVWVVARRDGGANAKDAFDKARRIATQATGLKQQFLGVYGQQRQVATGSPPASLPDTF